LETRKLTKGNKKEYKHRNTTNNMGTTQLNSEFGEEFADKKVHLESEVDQTTDNQESGSESEPEVYFLFSHRGRKHDPRGDKRMGLFGPFSPRGPKGFGFPFHDEPRRIDRHPHERPHDASNGRRIPPHDRGFRHRPHARNPEKDGFTEAIEGERGHSPHRGMRRFGPGPHGKRGSSLESDSEFHREPRHHGDHIRRPHGFGPRKHRYGPRNDSCVSSETEEYTHFPSYHLPRERRHRSRGGPRDGFESEEQIHLPRERRHRSRDGFEGEEQIHFPREHGHRHRGGPHNKLEIEELIHHLFQDYHHRGHGIGPRGRFEAEENAKHSNRNSGSHKYGHGPHRRFEAEGSVKEFHGKHEHRDGHPSLGNEHGRRGERGPRGISSRGRKHTRLDRKSGYFSNNSEHRDPHRNGFGPSDSRKFEHGRHRPDAEHKIRHHRGSHEFERARNGPESHYVHEAFKNNRGGFDLRGRHKLENARPHLHRHVPGHRIRQAPQLAEKIALLNSMGFPSENNAHYEELLKKFNGRIDDGNEDSGNEGSENEGDEENGDENNKTLEGYDIVGERADNTQI
ncbi:11567_t:CDS:2, partial [Acaulospora morrowiae]